MYTIVFCYKTERGEGWGSLPKESKKLDPSYKMDLEFWDCIGREKSNLIAEFHNTDFDFGGHSRVGKTLFCKRVNTVVDFSCLK